MRAPPPSSFTAKHRKGVFGIVVAHGEYCLGFVRTRLAQYVDIAGITDHHIDIRVLPVCGGLAQQACNGCPRLTSSRQVLIANDVLPITMK